MNNRYVCVHMHFFMRNPEVVNIRNDLSAAHDPLAQYVTHSKVFRSLSLLQHLKINYICLTIHRVTNHKPPYCLRIGNSVLICYALFVAGQQFLLYSGTTVVNNRKCVLRNMHSNDEAVRNFCPHNTTCQSNKIQQHVSASYGAIVSLKLGKKKLYQLQYYNCFL